MSRKQILWALIATLISLSLTACHGGGGGDDCMDDCEDDPHTDGDADSDSDDDSDTSPVCENECTDEGTFRCNPNFNMGPESENGDLLGRIEECRRRPSGCIEWVFSEYCDSPTTDVWCSEQGGTHCTEGCPDWVERPCGGFGNVGNGECFEYDFGLIVALERCLPHPDPNLAEEGCAIWTTIIAECDVGTCDNRGSGRCGS